GFKEERKLSYGVQYLQVGNGTQVAVEAIEMFNLVLPSGLVLKLNNCYYAPSIVRGVVSLSCLLDLGFHHTIASNGISISLNGKKIKAFRSDRGGKYLSQEFKDYLSENEIVQNLTSPYTPQQNGVSERRNHTLLDMVRSMFNLTTLPDLREPANYKTVMFDPDKVIWQGAMDEEMKSMKVNKVWIVVDRPPNAKVVAIQEEV
nr:retrovirus-related Pol polyprotein from transposon TNT 1-94 [Tanacetum cinerariifolium]